jgi:hypothetical protein
MNPFICITSNGGYIGRIAWCNTGSIGVGHRWGQWFMYPVSILGAWAGLIPMVRYLVR